MSLRELCSAKTRKGNYQQTNGSCKRKLVSIRWIRIYFFSWELLVDHFRDIFYRSCCSRDFAILSDQHGRGVPNNSEMVLLKVPI